MVGMIEVRHGAGLSGVTGKAAKAGETGAHGLFAKLLAMLEKRNRNAEKAAAIADPKAKKPFAAEGRQADKHRLPNAQGIATPSAMPIAAMLSAGADMSAHSKRGETANHRPQTMAGEQAPARHEAPVARDNPSAQPSRNALSSRPAAAPVLSTAVTGAAGLASAPDARANPARHAGDQARVPMPAADLGGKGAPSADNPPMPNPARHAMPPDADTRIAAQAPAPRASSLHPLIDAMPSDRPPFPPSTIAGKNATPRGEADTAQDAIAAQRSAAIAAHAGQARRGEFIATSPATAADTGRRAPEPLLDSGDASSRQSSHQAPQDGRALLLPEGSRISHAPAAGLSSETAHQPHAAMSIFDAMQYIAQSGKHGKTRLEIQLHPAHLGKINISLQTDTASRLQVHLIVDQPATRHLIEQHLPLLRQALAQQGLELSDFSLGSQSQGGQQGLYHQRHDGSGYVTPPADTDAPRAPRRETSAPSIAQSQAHAGLSIRI